MNIKEKALNEIERNFIKDLIFKEYTLSMNIHTFRIKDILNMCAQLLQSCSTVCNPVDSRPSGFSVNGILQQEYWSGLPCSPPGDLPNPGIEPLCITSLVLAGRFLTTNATWEASFCVYIGIKTIVIKLHRIS